MLWAQAVIRLRRAWERGPLPGRLENAGASILHRGKKTI